MKFLNQFDWDSFKMFGFLFDPSSKLYWLYILSAFVFAMIVLTIRSKQLSLKDKVETLFNPAELRSKSSWNDYLIFIVNSFILTLLIFPLIACFHRPSDCVISILTAIFGVGHFLNPASPIMTTTVFTVVHVLTMDLTFWFVHFLHHKIPVLWEFHKMHHSATTLNMVTAYRFHPIEDTITLISIMITTGIIFGIASYILESPPAIWVISGTNIFVIGFYLFGHNLRHTPVWVSYGKLLNHIFISPCQHQIHHSALPKHCDKNMGFIFAFWDYLFGTLYVPKKPESFPLGISGERHNHLGLADLYLSPFKHAYRILKPGHKGK